MIWSEQFAPKSLKRTNFPYFHVVFTLPNPIADIAYQTKAVVYARPGSVFAYSGGGWSARFRVVVVLAGRNILDRL